MSSLHGLHVYTESEAKEVCWHMWRSLACPSTSRTLFSGLRVSTHGKQVAPYSVRFLLTSQEGGVGPILPRVPHGEPKLHNYHTRRALSQSNSDHLRLTTNMYYFRCLKKKKEITSTGRPHHAALPLLSNHRKTTKYKPVD